MGRGRILVDLSALRSARFRRFLGAFSISTLGAWASLVCIPAAVEALGGTPFELALVMGAFFVPAGVVSVWGGALGDKFSRRGLMIGADVFSFTTQAAFASVLLSGHASIQILALSQLFLGVATGVFQVQTNGVIVEYVATSDARRGANALRGIIGSSGIMLGPAIGGPLLASSVGVGWAFALDAVSFLASAIILGSIGWSSAPRREALLQKEQPGEDTPDGADATEADAAADGDGAEGGLEIGAGWRAFRQTPWLVAVTAAFAVMNAFVFAPWQILGSAATDGASGGKDVWALILASGGLGAVVGGIVVMVWRPVRSLFVGTAAVGLWVLPLTLLAVSAPLPFILIGAVAAGGGTALFDAFFDTAIQDHVPEEVMSRLSSYDQVGSYSLLPVGYAAAGYAVATIGPSAGLWIAAALVFVCVALSLAIRSLRELGLDSSGVRAGEARQQAPTATPVPAGAAPR